MDKLKAFLTKQGPFGLPVYGYVIGAVVLVGGIWYFKTHSTGSATPAPQTNYPTGGGTPPMPFPDPGSGAAGVPPSSAFDLPSSGASVPQYTSQSNFVPAAASSTPSQAFASAVQTQSAVGQYGNYSPNYANYVQAPTPPVRVSSGGPLSSIFTAIQNIPSTLQSFNPVRPRSGGTQAI